MTRQKFTPSLGVIYPNAGGGLYRCVKHSENGVWMQNVLSGWTCLCIGTAIYDNGTIDWDYSLYGCFQHNNNP